MRRLSWKISNPCLRRHTMNLWTEETPLLQGHTAPEAYIQDGHYSIKIQAVSLFAMIMQRRLSFTLDTSDFQRELLGPQSSQHPLGTCQQCKSSGFSPDLQIKKCSGWNPAVCFTKSSRWFWSSKHFCFRESFLERRLLLRGFTNVFYSLLILAINTLEWCRMTDKFLFYKILRKLNTGQVVLMGEEIVRNSCPRCEWAWILMEFGGLGGNLRMRKNSQEEHIDTEKEDNREEERGY